MLFDDDLLTAARRLIEACRVRRLRLATAESCTGGLVAGLITEIAGASEVFERSFVSYSNAAKCEMLGVSEETITASGAVSENVARAMADGALARSQADLAVAITGIAGPGGGSAKKPVGLVWFALAATGRPTQTFERRFGDIGRQAVRRESVILAVKLFFQHIR